METYDGHILQANEINNWILTHIDSSSKRSSGSAGKTITRRQRKAFEEIVKKVEANDYSSLLFPKYTSLIRNYLGKNGRYLEKTGSAKIKEIPLKEKNITQINIGLGQGKALDTFNRNIVEFEVIKIIDKKDVNKK